MGEDFPKEPAPGAGDPSLEAVRAAAAAQNDHEGVTGNPVLDGLGHHFHHAVRAHEQKHEQNAKEHEQNAIEKDRERRVDSLADTLHGLIDNVEISSKETPPFEVERLDTGLRINAMLSGENGDVTQTARALVDKKEGEVARDYIKDGPYHAQVRDDFGLKQPFTLPFNGEEHDQVHYPKLARFSTDINLGLSVWATLESFHDDQSLEPTVSKVLVGTLVDPESILVPEPSDDPSKELYSIIGPEDARFQPVMQMIEHVANGQASLG
jgi:hypothetical protein